MRLYSLGTDAVAPIWLLAPDMAPDTSDASDGIDDEPLTIDYQHGTQRSMHQHQQAASGELAGSTYACWG